MALLTAYNALAEGDHDWRGWLRLAEQGAKRQSPGGLPEVGNGHARRLILTPD